MAFSNYGNWARYEHRRFEYRHRKSSRFYTSQLPRENWIHKRHFGRGSLIRCIYRNRYWINYIRTKIFIENSSIKNGKNDKTNDSRQENRFKI